MAVLSALKSLRAEFGNMSRAGKIKTIIFAVLAFAFITLQTIVGALTVTLFIAIILRVREKEITLEKQRVFALYMLFLAMFFLLGRGLFFYDDVEIWYIPLEELWELVCGYVPSYDYTGINANWLSVIGFVFFFMDFKR